MRTESVRRRRRRGQTLALMALLLLPMIGVLALVLDGGLMMIARRQSQTVADTASLAAAYMLYKHNSADAGLDPSGTAKAAALNTALNNGFANDGTASVVTVNIPPVSGQFAGKAGYVEVIAQYNQPKLFSALWGSGTLSVSARTVARGTLAAASNFAILVLDPSSSGSLQVGNSQGGGSTLTTVNGGIQVDSNNGTATAMSNNGTINTPAISIVGNYSAVGSSTINGTISTGASSVADPLASLTAPSTSGLTTQTPPNPYAYYPITLNPGIYPGGLTLSGGGSSVTMNPGLYYTQGGGFSVSNGVPVTGSGVTIYLDNSSGGGGTLDLMNGGGSITLSPPTSGPYAGISIFQDRGNTHTLNFGNGSNVNISGTIYAAGAMIQYTEGNNSAVYGSQIISKQLQVINGSTAKVTWNATNVARSRSIGIVE